MRIVYLGMMFAIVCMMFTKISTAAPWVAGIVACFAVVFGALTSTLEQKYQAQTAKWRAVEEEAKLKRAQLHNNRPDEENRHAQSESAAA